MNSQAHAQLLENLLSNALSEYFGKVDPQMLEQMRPRITTLQVHGGEMLIGHGEALTYTYILLTGRVRVTQFDREGNVTAKDTKGRGELIGEAALVSTGRSLQSAVALRDCIVMRMASGDFRQLLEAHPNAAMMLACRLGRRLHEPQAAIHPQRNISNICLLPLQHSLHMESIALTLRESLEAQLARASLVGTDEAQPVALLTSAMHHQLLGSGAKPGQVQPPTTSTWLDEQEMEHSMQVFVADSSDTEWTRLCLRHADHVLLVADADGMHDLTDLERVNLIRSNPTQGTAQSLLLLHPNDRTIPKDTQRWLAARPHIPSDGFSHFHVRRENPSDWARLARLMNGQAVGLVLSGGGAKGMVQYGVLKTLEERGVEWDMVGGTSIGAMVGGYAAMDIPMSTILKSAQKQYSSKPTSDFSWFPIMSVIQGRRLQKGAYDMLTNSLGATVQIEDLWKPFFCVASNYSKGEIKVLRSGDMAKAMLASAAIPAAFPPVLWGGDLLVDGGSFNNFPVDLMRESGAGRVIGIDIGRTRYRPLKLDRIPTGFQLFVDRFLRPRKYRKFKGIPSLPTTVFNISVLSSQSHQITMRAQTDICFTPDTSTIGMLDWGAFDVAVKLGVSHAKELMASDLRMFLPSWFAQRQLASP